MERGRGRAGLLLSGEALPLTPPSWLSWAALRPPLLRCTAKCCWQATLRGAGLLEGPPMRSPSSPHGFTMTTDIYFKVRFGVQRLVTGHY